MLRLRVRQGHVFDGEIALGYGQDVGFYTFGKAATGLPRRTTRPYERTRQ